MTLALFDFDGTITTKDSLVDFIQYAIGKQGYYMGLIKLSPMLLTYTLKIIPNYRAKEKLISHFFRGWDAERFQAMADRYSLEQIDKMTRPEAIEKIRWHQSEGHKIVLVSASMECWLKVWCGKNDIDLISTQLEVREGRLSGKFSSRNCYGEEKARRVKEAYNLDDYSHIYAYGDSRGDRELLSLADESFYKPFR